MVDTLKKSIESLKKSLEEQRKDGLFEKIEKEKQQAIKDRFYNRLSNSGMEEEEMNCRMKNFDAFSDNLKEVVKKCEEYIRNNNKINLILAGAVGTGKTHLACAVAKSMGYEKDEEFGIIKCSTIKQNQYHGYHILILDDIGREIGTERMQDFRRSQIAEIVEYRYRKRMNTIYTTNLNSSEITDIYGAHICDRMLNKAIIAPRIEEKSYRQRN